MRPYGAVRGIPVARGGVAWFGLVAMIAGFANPSSESSKSSPAGAYIFALSTIGLAVVLSLGYTSMFVLKTYCLLCLGTYACVIGIFIASGVTSSVPMTSLPGRLIRDLQNAFARPAQMTAGAIYVIALGAMVALFPSEATASAMTTNAAPPKLEGAAAKTAVTPGQEGDVKAQFEAWWNAQPRIETGVGLEGAKVVIVKFSETLSSTARVMAAQRSRIVAGWRRASSGAALGISSASLIPARAPGPAPAARRWACGRRR